MLGMARNTAREYAEAVWMYRSTPVEQGRRGMQRRPKKTKKKGCDASHSLGRENEQSQNKCSAGAVTFILSCKGIIANNAHYFDLEREAAAAAALYMTAAVRAREGLGSSGVRWAWEQRVRQTAGGGERASIGA